ncbi:MAG: hypothetical protein HXY34_06810 [Candidatus Thorarchaeota archaeon]|nr:hypothetical protein [Candidatus Thorarchaeota archaeon]
MGIPFLSNMFGGLGVFFKTRRYLAYLIIFVTTTFLALFVSYLMTYNVGGLEPILVNFFVYVGATGSIYFGIGVLLTALKLDNLWITRRGRGRVTELKGVAWLAVSFAIAVFMSILLNQQAILFFAMSGWIGWIAFQAYLSSRTSLRIATVAEPKKGGVVIGIGSFIILIIGLAIMAGEALAVYVLIPVNAFGIADTLQGIFPGYASNLATHAPFLLVAFGLLGLFGLIALLTFFRYARRGAALNVALLTVFIAVYSGYFLVNVMRRTGAPQIEAADVAMSLFFLLYAMSGIGRTVTEAVEESRSRLRDLGPLITFFLASGFFYVDSIIAVSATSGTVLSTWSQFDWGASTSFATFLFRDIAKLIAFPIAAIITMLYYVTVQRTERVLDRARQEGRTFEPGEVDSDVAAKAPKPGEAWPTETTEGVKKGKQGHDLSTPDSRRLVVDESRRLGKPKRLGEEEDKDKEK